MKKLVYTLLCFSFFSCNYILKNYNNKEDNQTVSIDTSKSNQLTTDLKKDECELKSGYKWSNIQKKCIRVFELGYRMSSIEKDSLGKSKNAYFFIEEDSLKAEIFLPDSTESIVLIRENENDNFLFKNYQLQTNKGFLIFDNKQIAFKPALAKDLPTVGKDEEY